MPTFTQEADLSVSAPRLWRAMKDSKTLYPKIAPQLIASVEDDDDDNKVGCVRCIRFGTDAPYGAYVKEKLIALDREKYSVTVDEFEGGHLNLGFSKWTATIKFVPIDDKSCKFHVTVDYEGDNEAGIAQAKEGYVKLTKGLSEYIESNNAYA